MFKWLRKKPQPAADVAVLGVLLMLREHVERMNIPVVRDDYDAGYDMAVDEVLVLIDRMLNPDASDDDVNYGDAV